MGDVCFKGLHTDEEHLPVGGSVSWVSDATVRVRLLLYPVALPEIGFYPWDYNPPPQGAAVETAQGDRQVRISDKPLRLNVVRGGRTITVRHPIETFPLFVRCGGIVPMETAPVRAVPDVHALEVRLR